MKPASTPSPSLAADEIRRRVAELGPWFHNLDLGGVRTAPHHFLGDYPEVKWRRFAGALPPDLEGRSVLDIGCNAGFFSLALKKRGAGRVVAIDHDEAYLAQARFAAEVCGESIEFRRMSVYDVASLNERFDLVLFMGVFYHLRHPLLALDLVREHAARDLLLFQSMQRGADLPFQPEDDYPFSEVALFEKPEFPRMHFIENRYAEDPTNWWIPNRSCVEGLLRSSGFDILSRPEEEVFLCRCRRGAPAGAVYPKRRESQS